MENPVDSNRGTLSRTSSSGKLNLKYTSCKLTNGSLLYDTTFWSIRCRHKKPVSKNQWGLQALVFASLATTVTQIGRRFKMLLVTICSLSRSKWSPTNMTAPEDFYVALQRMYILEFYVGIRSKQFRNNYSLSIKISNLQLTAGFYGKKDSQNRCWLIFFAHRWFQVPLDFNNLLVDSNRLLYRVTYSRGQSLGRSSADWRRSSG